jgi:dolichyl-phosphate-mannose--protein O-mannosyl transferase
MKKYNLMLTLAFAQDFLLEPEFESVTCGSVIKLSNKLTGYRLHSHEVEYGSGSGQQSVTGFLTGNDPNSYFVIQGKQSTRCVRGTSIQCGEVITLKHQNTGKYLHSHIIPSPISNQQEVSAHDSNDSGDNWKIGCSTNVWKRESAVTIRINEF